MLIKRSNYRYSWWPDGSTEENPVGGFDLFDDGPKRPLSLWSFGIFEEKNRGNGYGQQMLSEAIAMAENRDIELFVMTSNKIAIHVYEKAGFEVVGAPSKSAYTWRMVRKATKSTSINDDMNRRVLERESIC